MSAEDDDTPDWVREMEAAAAEDPTIAALLQGTGGNPEAIQQRMRAEMDAVHARIMNQRHGGEEAPMEVTFREVDQFDLWVWLELYRPPAPSDLDNLQEVINSWFLLGRLGGYNSANLQVLYSQSDDLTDLDYEAGGDSEAAGLTSSLHDMSPVETQGSWARFWVDLGTADELALDVLINTLTNFSREGLGIKTLVVGGANDDWEVPEEAGPEVTMDPMRGPIHYDD